MQKFRLDKRVCIITGGAGLLGVEHGNAILAAGGRVVLLDIDRDSLAESGKELSLLYPSGDILEVVADINKEESLINAVNKITEKFGTIDILINNEAVNPVVTNDLGDMLLNRLESFELSEWNRQLSVGLTGAFLCAKIFGSYMANNGGGVILNISSDLSVIAPDQRLYALDGVSTDDQPVKPVTYSVIKTGLIGLTRYLATYWIDKNVRCNALSPGGVYAGQSDKFVDRLTEMIPMGRMASKDEYHSAVQFLCSDASSYMTGQNIVVDGGRSVW